MKAVRNKQWLLAGERGESSLVISTGRNTISAETTKYTKLNEPEGKKPTVALMVLAQVRIARFEDRLETMQAA